MENQLVHALEIKMTYCAVLGKWGHLNLHRGLPCCNGNGKYICGGGGVCAAGRDGDQTVLWYEQTDADQSLLLFSYCCFDNFS